MAVWQFDVNLIPTAALERRYGRVPETVPEADRREAWWDGTGAAADLDELDALLGADWPLHKGFPGYRSWGSEDGNRIEYATEDAEAAEEKRLLGMHARIDVRTLNPRFVEHVCRVAQTLDCRLMLWEDGSLLPPEPARVVAAIRRSRSYRLFGQARD